MVINSVPPRSTKTAPFKLLTWVDIRFPEDHELCKILESEAIQDFEKEREEVRSKARENIERIQTENCKT